MQPLVPPARKLHRWWMAQARACDPATVPVLLATLHRDAGGRDADRLVERVEQLLAWPPDPRIARALAALVHEAPLFHARHCFRPSPVHPRAREVVDRIARRVVEIGDLPAIELVALAWTGITDDLRARIRATAAAAPEPLAAPPDDAPLAAAWRAVADDPFALAPRLVLADAYMERDHPRGELIRLQCAPLLAIERARAAGEAIDPSGLFGVAADRIARLETEHWHDLLGPLALLVSRRAKFHGGLLSRVEVGLDVTPPWLWARAAGDRELCALQALAPTRACDREVFADFVEALVYAPRRLVLDGSSLRVLRARARTLPASGIELSLYDMGGALARIVDDVRAVFPQLARLDLGRIRERELPAVRDLAYRVRLERLVLTVDGTPSAEELAIAAELRALPHVRLLAYAF